MSDDVVHLHVLLVEDDKENLALLRQSLPGELAECQLHYDPYDSFGIAVERLTWQRYDMVVTDIYRDRLNVQKRDMLEPDALGRDIVTAIRARRFCPIVAFTDGSFPDSLAQQQGPFLKLVDKSAGDREIVQAMEEILSIGIPQVSRRLHDELDQAAGPSFLWKFLEERWSELQEKGHNSERMLERMIRRRASVQLGRIDPSSDSAQEVKHITAPEFYIMPPISAGYRLGHVLQRNGDQQLFVLLTPHCYLETQQEAGAPRADHVLLVTAVPFKEVMRKHSDKDPSKCDESKRDERIRRAVQSPAQVGKPSGRYWFLPAFLDIPDSYCDFLQVHSVQHETLAADYKALAVLDTPFAEAFQSCFTSFYSSVGLPNLNPQDFRYLAERDESANG